MAAKKAKEEGAQKRAPKPALKALTERERRAHDAMSGMVDESLPVRAKKLLSRYPGQVGEVVAKALGTYRFSANAVAASLQVSERREQAEQLRQLAAELRERVQHIDPYLEAYLEQAWWPSSWNTEPRQPFSAAWRREVEPWLLRLGALAKAAGEAMPEGRKGRKRVGHRDRFVADVVAVLRSVAGLGIRESREHAQAIAQACGIQAPTDDRSLRRQVGA